MKGSGACIILSAEPRGRFDEGLVAGGNALFPGTVVQIAPGVAPIGGRFSFIPYTVGADGNPPVGPIGVLLPDSNSGFSALTSIANGQRCRVYYPLPGDELNMLVEGEAGTGSANEFDIGDRFTIRNATGKLILESTASHSAPFVCNEEITETPSLTDTLVWCTFSGSV